MNDTKILIGSLSNDLFRVASLTQRGSIVGARRFLVESKKWASELSGRNLKRYIEKVVVDILSESNESLTVERAERLLMYGILLQNYSLHMHEN